MIRFTLAIIGVVLVFAGYGAVIVSSLAGIGYSLYGFAHGVALALALWNGFCLFLLLLIGGALAIGIGWLLTYFKF